MLQEAEALKAKPFKLGGGRSTAAILPGVRHVMRPRWASRRGEAFVIGLLRQRFTLPKIGSAESVEGGGDPLNSEGTGPDTSRADFVFCMTAYTWGFSVDDIAKRLMEEPDSKAHERGQDGRFY